MAVFVKLGAPELAFSCPQVPNSASDKVRDEGQSSVSARPQFMESPY